MAREQNDAEERSQGERRRGQIIAVWGAHGAPGRTTLAVNYAVETSLAGSRVVLVDADTYGASVSVVLGLLEESAGIAQLCRLSDQGVLDEEGFQRACPVLSVAGTSLRVVTGLPRPTRWPELRKAAVDRVLDFLTTVADMVVVDLAPFIDIDEDLAFDTAAPQRNAATLAVLERADEILAVGRADSIGVPRLIKSLERLAESMPSALPRVVFNFVSRDALGPNPERQLRETWARYGPGAPIRGFLPWEPQTMAAALLAGKALAEAFPEQPLRASIAQLAGHDVAPTRGLLARRRRTRERAPKQR